MGANGRRVKGGDIVTVVLAFLVAFGALSILPLKMAGEVDIHIGWVICITICGAFLMFIGIDLSVNGFDSSTPSMSKGSGYSCSGDAREGSDCHGVGGDGCGGCADAG
ncbi:hypothetical protein GCM10010245_36240 [Streptomyces spectabilis]|uniref:Uncharacterized protein n=1 Tax=Streptomyces spectabilis TaxID=68270 RepID=A0A7W8AXU8_STRST|nr:hypothetical protein [Streptomyces spectabilis]GGV21498.1 hypothetical protein GCM10010245_36240 [Streptomyces spectabilis]